MKSFRNPLLNPAHRRRVSKALIALGLCGVSLAAWEAHASLPRWMQEAVNSSAIEAALYRVMEIPGVKALYPRPPKEAAGELGVLIGKSAKQADLYSLRAMEEEQSLDFSAAESDWKKYAELTKDKTAAQLELADYYHRRLQTAEELKALTRVGSAPASASEEYVVAAEQQSWRAFERIQTLAADQGLDDATVSAAYTAWIARYPNQPSLYNRELHWLLYQSNSDRRFGQADELIRQYRQTFPKDTVFQLKAAALIQMRRGSPESIDKALALYDSGFEPLWPAELVQSYYALLSETHRQRKFLADAQARLARNPDDLNAMTRLFYYAQQQGNLQSATQIVEGYRVSKENRKGPWSAQELYTLATLMEAIHAYPEAARYDFALYHSQGSLSTGVAPQAEGLSAIIRILLSAPDQPVELGANNLTMYRDLATVDRGPGYWNGILSLWLNSESPEQSYHDEEQRAQPYFHRAKAAQLLEKLDKEYPQAPLRAELHKELIRTLADYGEAPLVIDAGNSFLTTFPSSQEETNRVSVAMYMADAYARERDTKAEFALYDRMLTELGSRTAGMPLTAAAASLHSPASGRGQDGQNQDSQGLNSQDQGTQDQGTQDQGTQDGAMNDNGVAQPAKVIEKSRAFEIGSVEPSGIQVAGSQEYQQLLERYLGRLTAVGQLPEALAVLRKELDRNPNDPLLYERLATFLEQNNLSAQQEEVYNQAIQKFQSRGWYDKLARLYLREKKRQAYADLTRKVTDIFSGSELEAYFNVVNGGGGQLYLELNLYAHQRFPHDEVFVEHLLGAYHSRGTYDQAAWEKLIREHWSDTEDLRQQFFDYLSNNGKLDAEMVQLRSLVPGTQERKANPNAVRELAEAELWQSHFEESAPLLDSVAAAYPADEEVGTEASSVFRSLAYFDTRETEHAVTIEKRLLAATPANLDRLARIGDIYSDSGADSSPGHENIQAATPYWRRMPAIHPGKPDGYLQAATIFWDYYQFDDALAEIREARKHFNKPALYGYEAGAIYEGKRDMASAIREYTAAAIESPGASNDAGDSSSSERLLQLARRKASAKIVDEETTKALSASAGNNIPALELRERVLEVQHRNAEIGPLLESALQQSTTLEQAQAIGAQAQAHSLPKLYEMALQREVSLANDPVQKIELTYALVRMYEERKDTGDATQLIDKAYQDNSKLLGVVRTTVDFYWRNQQQAKAISILLEASKAADATQPELSRSLLVEAADKANSSGNYAQARTLMAPLVGAGTDAAANEKPGAVSGIDPYNAQYIEVVAEGYARAGDDAGLKKFYLDKLTAIRGASATMTADERKQKTVLLRRGLIPALTRMKDYAGAVEQYIAILSSYPEDSGTAQEAALFALRYSRREQLVDFVSKTVKASPRDSRFAIMLGQIDTLFEDYPGAIDAYARAISIRSDRSDVYTAKADLEERTQQLDDACKEYERLYVLSYQNPQWMVKVAEARARQGRKEDAVKALERAWIAGHSATANDYFRVAEQLESWKMMDASLHYAELGVKAEGDALLAGNDGLVRDADDPEGAVIYTRLLTKMREQNKALKMLDEARASADKSPNSPALVIEQAEKQGLASVSNEEWRNRRVALRRQTADQRYKSSILEMGKTVKTYFTPEEKTPFAQMVDARWNATRSTTFSDHLQWIDVAEAAGVVDEEAKMRKDELLAPAFPQESALSARMQAYVRLQRSRMKYRELAQTLDAYADKVRPVDAPQVRLEEAHAYRSAGDELAELAILRKVNLRASGSPVDRVRYFDLLLKHDIPAFESFGKMSEDPEYALSAPNYAVQHSDMKVARITLSNHTDMFKGQWENAYTSLLGLYFRDLSASTEGSFHNLLGDEQTIGQRILSHTGVNADSQENGKGPIAGNKWFYYGMRYGVYRTLAPKKDWPQRDPEDYLPAGLEENNTVANYVVLARAYTDSGEVVRAIAEYRHALELAPDSPAIHDAIALLLWQSGKREDAITEWRLALVILNRILNKGPAPESFWIGFERIAQHLGSRKLATQLHPEMDSVLRAYMKINGNYRSEELLKSAFDASSNPAEGIGWILSLCEASNTQLEILQGLNDSVWIPASAREPILLRELDLARIAASNSEANDYASQRLLQARSSLALYYVAQKKNAEAEDILRELTDAQRQEESLFDAEIELAARGHRIEALLNGMRVEDASQQLALPQRWQMLRTETATLTAEGFKAEALAIWEFVFEQLQLTHNLMASDYMGLAEARLKTGDVAGAVAVLRRMTMLGSDVGATGGMENYDHAATLLVENGHDEEAVAFLTALVKGVPWDASFSLRLAQAELRMGRNQAEAIQALEALAGESQQDYELRIQAALCMEGKSSSGVKFGSEELELLASGKVTGPQARQPYFVAARIVAAEALPLQSSAERIVLLHEALALEPAGLSTIRAATPIHFTGNDLALKIFVDEATLGHSATALVAVEPLLNQSNRFPDGIDSSGNEEVDDGDANTDANGSNAEEGNERPAWLSDGSKTLLELERDAPLPSMALSSLSSDTDKAHLAALVAHAYEDTDHLAKALPYLRLARYLQKDTSQISELAQQIDKIEKTLWLESRNVSRRPLIQKDLNQSTVVRPRLTSVNAVSMEEQ